MLWPPTFTPRSMQMITGISKPTTEARRRIKDRRNRKSKISPRSHGGAEQSSGIRPKQYTSARRTCTAQWLSFHQTGRTLDEDDENVFAVPVHLGCNSGLRSGKESAGHKRRDF